MKKVLLGALVAAIASVAFLGVARTPSTYATPTAILLLRPATVDALAGSDCTVANACDFAADNAPDLAKVAGVAAGTILTPDMFAAVDVDANQLVETTGTLWVLAFVSNDSSVSFSTDAGLFAQSGAVNYTCSTDEDCNGNTTRGDGVAVATLQAGAASLGSAQVHVTQAPVTVSETFTVVGAPDSITLAAVPAGKSVIQTGGDAAGTGNCQVSKLASVLAMPQYVGLSATVSDAAGTAINGWPVFWSVSNSSAGALAAPVTISLTSALGDTAPNVLCGGTATGTDTVTARTESGAGFHADVAITVVGAPAALVATAAPNPIVCNGTNTSVVTATVKDSAGNPVADGTAVTFEAVALAGANPINATTTAGVASSTITPLASVSTGVVVNVLAGSQAVAVRIDCQAAAPTPVPTTGPGTGITPPSTGTGGYSDSGSFSWLALAGLLGAGSVLFAGGLTLRRLGR